MTNDRHMYTIILAGGSGTRLFPLSRSSYPKQFIPLFNNESLFQKSVKRALLFSKPEEIYIVTNDTHIFLVKDQLKPLKIACNILTEPCGKNTLPAITYAITKIKQTNLDAVVLILPSDQFIIEDGAYISAIQTAEKLAKHYLVTFGIIPTTPHTGYGYIHQGEAITGGYTVEAFVEKPDYDTAKKYLKEGYLWNSGMFCFSVKLFEEESRKWVPKIVEAFSHSIKEAYELTPKISIDYGLMEKTDVAAVVPLSSSWNDIGNYDALYSISEKDTNENVVQGEYITTDGKNNLIISDKLVATIGLSNLAIIDTPDVLLICPKDQAQKVGQITASLSEQNDERVVLHTTVHRPWGIYTVLLKNTTYLIKRLTVYPKNRLSLQYHKHRSEHWIVVSGTAEVTTGERTLIIHTGESTFIPTGVKHRLANPNTEPLEIIEVQIGETLTEEDIVRLDDDYKRDK